MNLNSRQNESKPNANSIFVRVHYIRARINRDKYKDKEKKSRRRRLEKKSDAVVADLVFNFCFLSFLRQSSRGRVSRGNASKGNKR